MTQDIKPLVGRITVTTWGPWSDETANAMATSVLATCLGVMPGSERWNDVMVELPRQRLAMIRDMLHQRWGIMGWTNRRYGDLRGVTICLPEVETRSLYDLLRSQHTMLNWRVEMYVPRY
jgi:hypothetical protein